MKNHGKHRSWSRRVCTVALAAYSLLASNLAVADNHALILWAGDDMDSNGLSAKQWVDALNAPNAQVNYTGSKAANWIPRSDKHAASPWQARTSVPPEPSFPGSSSGIAMLAWIACLRDPATDTDHSGLLNGHELEVCARQWVRAQGQAHHAMQTKEFAAQVQKQP